MAGYDTTWKMADRVVHLGDIIRYLNRRRRRVYRIPAQSLYKMLRRRLETGRKRMMRTDISVPIIVEVDRVTGRPVVVLDGNHRLAKAISLNTDVHMRVLYSDERDELFGE
jgi:FKBP-type peptidyl-prolyl cis-trans isomerase 2